MREVKLQTCQIMTISDNHALGINRGPGNEINDEDDVY